jgi:predicted DNA-binding protein
MGDNYKRSRTAHTSYRLPDTVKNKLGQLATLDGTTKTETLKRLINQEYRTRLDEIKTLKEISNVAKS